MAAWKHRMRTATREVPRALIERRVIICRRAVGGCRRNGLMLFGIRQKGKEEFLEMSLES